MAFWVVMVIAVVNVSLGFAATVFLARRSRPRGLELRSSSQSNRPFEPGDLAAFDAAFAPPPVQSDPEADVPADRFADEPGQGSAEAPRSAEASEEPVGPAAVEPSAEPASGPAEVPSPAEPGRTAGQRAIEDLIRHVEDYQARLTALDGQLRAGAASPDAAAVQSCADLLRQANDEYVESRSAAYEQFREACKDGDDLRAVCDNVDAAVEAQKAEILAAAETVRGLQSGQQPVGDGRQIVAQSARLLAAADRLRDRLQEALTKVVRSGPALAAHAERLPADGLTGILSCSGLEAELESLRHGDPELVRPVGLVMLDLDHFGQVNERCGYEAGNRILRAVATLLAAESRPRCAVARVSGQRFAALVPDADIQAATGLAERIRQTIEACRFEYQESAIPVTVSCGVAGARPHDTSEALFARAGNAVQEAKRYGRNRTFFHEGRYPSPVVPSNLTIQPRMIAL